MMSTPMPFMTAREFFQLPDWGQPVEWVHGRLKPMYPPGLRHGHICLQIASQLQRYLDDQPLGRAVCNDAGVVTRRDPDTVRGADIAYFSYQQLPETEPFPDGYHDLAPDIVWEVLSPSDSRRDSADKAREYLDAGVSCVAVIDPDSRTAHIYDRFGTVRSLSSDDSLTFPEILPGFELKLARLLADHRAGR